MKSFQILNYSKKPTILSDRNQFPKNFQIFFTKWPLFVFRLAKKRLLNYGVRRIEFKWKWTKNQQTERLDLSDSILLVEYSIVRFAVVFAMEQLISLILNWFCIFSWILNLHFKKVKKIPKTKMSAGSKKKSLNIFLIKKSANDLHNKLYLFVQFRFRCLRNNPSTWVGFERIQWTVSPPVIVESDSFLTVWCIVLVVCKHFAETHAERQKHTSLITEWV